MPAAAVVMAAVTVIVAVAVAETAAETVPGANLFAVVVWLAAVRAAGNAHLPAHPALLDADEVT